MYGNGRAVKKHFVNDRVVLLCLLGLVALIYLAVGFRKVHVHSRLLSEVGGNWTKVKGYLHCQHVMWSFAWLDC